MKLNDVLLVLERATQAGTSLVFGYLGGGPTPFEVSDPVSNFVLAFRALPIVLVISALSALLFYWRVLPAIVRALSFVLEKAMRVGGVVGLSTAANVFVGMVEAPLFVRPYLARVSRGELFAHHGRRHGVDRRHGALPLRQHPRPRAARRGGAPADRLDPFRAGGAGDRVPHGSAARPRAAPSSSCRSEASGSMDALTRGTLEGAQLLLNIVAMLVVFVALVALVNLIIAPYTLQGALGWVLAPLAWLAGFRGARRAPRARCSARRR